MATLYDNLSDISNEIIQKFKDNDTFQRLVGNDKKTALTDAVPDFNSLVFQRLFPFIKPLNPEGEKGTYVMVSYEEGSFSGQNNIYQHDAVFEFVFLCHKDVWFMNDKKIRPYEMLAVCYDVLGNASLSQAIRKTLIVRAPKRVISHTGEYAGYKMRLEFTGSNIC